MQKNNCRFLIISASLALSTFLFLQTTIIKADDYHPSSSAYLIGVDCAGKVIITGSIDCTHMWDTIFGTIKYDFHGDKVWQSYYSLDRPQKVSADAPSAMVISPTGEVIVAGHSNGETLTADGYMEKDFATVKNDPYGNQLWVAKYNGPKRDSYYEAKDLLRFVALDKSGNIFVTGATCIPSETLDFCCNVVTIKYSSEGEELWVSLHESCVEGVSGSMINGFAVDEDGNSYVLADAQRNSDEHIIVKHDADGNKLWVHDEEMYWNDISVDSEGNICLTGRYPFSYDGDVNNIVLGKYDPDGDEIWFAESQTNDIPSGGILIMDKDNNIYVGATIWDEGMTTVKFDSEGNELWMKLSDNARIENMTVDLEGNVVVIGEVDEGEVNYEVIKYDREGSHLWTVLYYKRGASDHSFDPHNAVFDVSGNLYITGSKFFYDGSQQYYNYMTIMYDKNGNEIWVSEYQEGCGESEVFIEYDHPCYHGEDDDTDDTDDDQADDDDNNDSDDSDTCGCGCS